MPKGVYPRKHNTRKLTDRELSDRVRQDVMLKDRQSKDYAFKRAISMYASLTGLSYIDSCRQVITLIDNKDK